MPHRSQIFGVILGLALSLLATGSVWAAIWVEFYPSSAPAGATVEVRGHGFPSSLSLAIFLAPKEVADAITSPSDPRLIAIGVLAANQTGDGSIRFVVPNLPAGTYQGLIHCEPCAPHSAGRIIVPGEYFSVTPATLPGTGTDLTDYVRQGMLLTLVGTLLVTVGLGLIVGTKCTEK